MLGKLLRSIRPDRWWRFRYRFHQPDVTNLYQMARYNDIRNYLADMVANRKPSSVLDVGCGFGQDLYLMSRRLLTANLVGVDINHRMVHLGNKELDSRASNAILMKGSLYDLHMLPSYDVIYSRATLMYVPPDKIDGVLSSLHKKCHCLILAEFQGDPQLFRGKWVHDYERILQSLGMNVAVYRSKFKESFRPETDWGQFGAVIEAV